VPLRDYRAHASIEQRRGRLEITPRIAGAAAVAGGLILVGLVLSLKGESVGVPTDLANLCPTDRPVSQVTVILLDVSDRFSEPQRLQIQNQLARLRDSMPRFGLVEVYAVDRIGRRLTEPVFHVCNPGTGAELSRIYQNPELARKKWDRFAERLAGDIDRQMAEPATGASPIFEAIQAAGLRTFSNPAYDGVPKRLIIVSDLLQNVPGRLDMYRQLPAFRSFRRTPYFSRVRADLSGVAVTIFYLSRPEVRTQGRRHLGFWDAYLSYQGAGAIAAVGVFGDR
jgi:hypothetical protein